MKGTTVDDSPTNREKRSYLKRKRKKRVIGAEREREKSYRGRAVTAISRASKGMTDGGVARVNSAAAE